MNKFDTIRDLIKTISPEYKKEYIDWQIEQLQNCTEEELDELIEEMRSQINNNLTNNANKKHNQL